MINNEKVYIGGRGTAAERLMYERARVRAIGYKVDSSWMEECAKYTDPNNIDDATALHFAAMDIRDLKACDMVIIDTLDETAAGGGREVEFGLALSNPRYPTLIRVGPRRNVFHTIVAQSFENWDACIAWLIERDR